MVGAERGFWDEIGGFAFGSLISSAAFADITVTNYSLPDPSSFSSVTTDGYSYYTGPIVLSTTIGPLTVYCADLNHDMGHHVTKLNFFDLSA